MTISNKTNISRQIDREYGYDLEIEVSYSRDGMACHGYINGECKAFESGRGAESEVKRRLYAAVTFDIERGATPIQCQECGKFDCTDNHVVEETTMTNQPTYAELVAAREAAYTAQRDAERELAQLKARLTADIAADPSFKNETSRKAELTDRLYGYDIFIDFDSITDAYRAALAAIEVYQEAAKDARARLRYETAQMELRAAEINLQVAQARHDAAEPTDESPYGELPKPKFVLWGEHEVSTNVEESCDGDNPIGHIAARYDDDGNFECYETRPGEQLRVYAKVSDALDAAKDLINNPEYERPWALPVYLKFPF